MRLTNMIDVNESRLERLEQDLMDRGMNETEAHFRAKAFLKNVGE